MHVVNIVTLPSGSSFGVQATTKFMVDVGFGGDMATVPVPLIALFSPIIHNNIGTQEIRLEHGRIPGMRAPADQKVWIYQARNGPDQPWFSAFCFSETEFLEQDLEVLNWHTSRDPRCFQTSTLLVVRFLMGEGEKKICGKVMMVNDLVKENLGGKTRVVKTCRTEGERVEVLETMFGISLTKEQREGIKGKAVEIKE